jgi:protein ImuA
VPQAPPMSTASESESVREAVETLRQRVRQVEMASVLQRPEDAAPIPTGCPALDRLLPDRGWRRGTLVEWLADQPGSGAGTLAMIAAREAALEGGAVVVMDNRGDFYPAAAAVLGIDLNNLIVIRTKTEKDRLWALDQALRCQGVAAVWAPQEKIDPHTFRRLQLAAESSGALGVLVRDQQARGLPTWSSVQLLARPGSGRGQGGEDRGERLEVRGRGAGVRSQESGGRRQGAGGGEFSGGASLHNGKEDVGGDRWVRVELLRSRQGKSGGWVELQIDSATGAIREACRTDEPHLVHPPAQLVRAANRRRSARA